MLNQIFLILLFIFTPLIITAQKLFEHTISEPYQVVDAESKHYYTNKKTGKVLSIKINGNNLVLTSFDSKKMIQLKTADKRLPEGANLSKIHEAKDKLYLFYTTWEQQDKSFKLWGQELDIEGCNFKGAAKKMIYTDEKALLTYHTSFDSTKLLIQYRKNAKIKRDAINYDIISLYTFDNKLNSIGKKEIKMPYTESQMDNMDYGIDAEGKPYLWSVVRPTGLNLKALQEAYKNKDENYSHFEFFKIDLQSGSLVPTKTMNEGSFLINYHIREGLNSMLCLGTYNTMDKFGSVFFGTIPIQGFFVFKLGKDGGVEKKFYDIGGVSDFHLRKVVVEPDNSILFVGEIWYSTTTIYGPNKSKTIYHSDDIIAAKIDSNGSMIWWQKLPKAQESTKYTKGGVGFQYVKLGDKHCFVFLDNVKNMDLSLNEKLAKHVDGRGGYLTAYSIDDESGTVEKMSIFNILDVNAGEEVLQFSVDRIFPISENEFMLEAYKKSKEDVMIKVKIGQ